LNMDVAARHLAIMRQVRRGQLWRTTLLAGVLAVVVLSLWYGEFFDLQRLSKGIPAVLQVIFREGFPPDFSRLNTWLYPLLDTVAMSIAGTGLAVLLSFLLCFLAARNTTPHPVLYWLARLFLNLVRSVPELIMGIILLAAVGLGILPGILALALHSVGMLGKFFAEAIEHADLAPVEAVQACGGRPLQVFFHGILPQVLPQLVDVSLYRWEFNFRASTVMGMVGCGGIGFQLMAALSLLEYRQVTALLIIVLLCVSVVDGCGAFLRRKFK